MLDRLGGPACAACDDGGPGSHRLDGDEAERLGPGAQHERRQGARVQRVPLGFGELAQELDHAVVDGRLDDLLEVPLLVRVVHLCGHAKWQSGPARELDAVGDPLLGCNADDEGEVAHWLVRMGHSFQR